jgi:hypothetical protein
LEKRAADAAANAAVIAIVFADYVPVAKAKAKASAKAKSPRSAKAPDPKDEAFKAQCATLNKYIKCQNGLNANLEAKDKALDLLVKTTAKVEAAKAAKEVAVKEHSDRSFAVTSKKSVLRGQGETICKTVTIGQMTEFVIRAKNAHDKGHNDVFLKIFKCIRALRDVVSRHSSITTITAKEFADIKENCDKMDQEAGQITQARSLARRLARDKRKSSSASATDGEGSDNAEEPTTPVVATAAGVVVTEWDSEDDEEEDSDDDDDDDEASDEEEEEGAATAATAVVEEAATAATAATIRRSSRKRKAPQHIAD